MVLPSLLIPTGGGILSKPVEQMSKQELKQYLSQNRNDDYKFSQAMELLLAKMPPQQEWNHSFSSFEEADQFFEQYPIQE